MRQHDGAVHAQNSTSSALHVECTTWSRDSHGLFDYEARHVNVKKFLVSRSARFFRLNARVECVPENAPVPSASVNSLVNEARVSPDNTQSARGCAEPNLSDLVTPSEGQEQNPAAEGTGTTPTESLPNTDFLLSIRTAKDGKYFVVPADRSLCGTTTSPILPQKLWLIVRDQNDNKYTLQENDIIKLGRYKLRVKQLVTQSAKREDDASDNAEHSQLRLEDGEPPISYFAPEDTQCRICLLEGNQENDPLISPCDCKGSIKFVHLECLRHWINGRMSFNEQNPRPFFVRQLHCELCKIPYPSAVHYHRDADTTERMQVVSVPRTDPPFIVLENMVSTQQKGVYVISMQQKKDLKLGRGHESDVRIPDVSISRYHATIRFVEGSFQLEDHNSKFGTLVSLRKPFSIGELFGAALQVGRSVVKLSIDSTSSVVPDSILDVSDVEHAHDPQFQDFILPPDGLGSNSGAIDGSGEGSVSVVPDVDATALPGQNTSMLYAPQAIRRNELFSAGNACRVFDIPPHLFAPDATNHGYGHQHRHAHTQLDNSQGPPPYVCMNPAGEVGSRMHCDSHRQLGMFNVMTHYTDLSCPGPLGPGMNDETVDRFFSPLDFEVHSGGYDSVSSAACAFGTGNNFSGGASDRPHQHTHIHTNHNFMPGQDAQMYAPLADSQHKPFGTYCGNDQSGALAHTHHNFTPGQDVPMYAPVADSQRKPCADEMSFCGNHGLGNDGSVSLNPMFRHDGGFRVNHLSGPTAMFDAANVGMFNTNNGILTSSSDEANSAHGRMGHGNGGDRFCSQEDRFPSAMFNADSRTGSDPRLRSAALAAML